MYTVTWYLSVANAKENVFFSCPNFVADRNGLYNSIDQKPKLAYKVFGGPFLSGEDTGYNKSLIYQFHERKPFERETAFEIYFQTTMTLHNRTHFWA